MVEYVDVFIILYKDNDENPVTVTNTKIKINNSKNAGTKNYQIN